MKKKPRKGKTEYGSFSLARCGIFSIWVRNLVYGVPDENGDQPWRRAPRPFSHPSRALWVAWVIRKFWTSRFFTRDELLREARRFHATHRELTTWDGTVEKDKAVLKAFVVHLWEVVDRENRRKNGEKPDDRYRLAAEIRQFLLDGKCPVCAGALGSCPHGYEEFEYVGGGKFRYAGSQ